jgi:hypothetical protein
MVYRVLLVAYKDIINILTFVNRQNYYRRDVIISTMTSEYNLYFYWEEV